MPRGVVYVIDDDSMMCEVLIRLVESVGLVAQAFMSAQQFLDYDHMDRPACIISDILMPGLSGLDLQDQLAKLGLDLPIIFITGQGDVPTSVKAMKAGAVDFLMKPFLGRDLLQAVEHALRLDDFVQRQRVAQANVLQRFATLTQREREVMELAVKGFPNKQIAAELGTAEITVKIQRGRVMKKMKAASFADLVRMGQQIEGNPVKSE